MGALMGKERQMWTKKVQSSRFIKYTLKVPVHLPARARRALKAHALPKCAAEVVRSLLPTRSCQPALCICSHNPLQISIC